MASKSDSKQGAYLVGEYLGGAVEAIEYLDKQGQRVKKDLVKVTILVSPEKGRPIPYDCSLPEKTPLPTLPRGSLVICELRRLAVERGAHSCYIDNIQAL